MVGAVFGQSKLDLQSQMELQRLRNTSIPTYNARTRSFERPKVAQQNTLAMVELMGGCTREDLEAQGVEVLRVRGNIAIVALPVSDVERISTLTCVYRMELPRRLFQKMDVVRAEIGVDKIHKGIELPQAYTGKGVVTGIVDGGIDPNHINFLKPDGSTRFGYISKIIAAPNERKAIITIIIILVPYLIPCQIVMIHILLRMISLQILLQTSMERTQQELWQEVIRGI